MVFERKVDDRGSRWRRQRRVELDEVQRCNEMKIVVGGKRPASFIVDPAHSGKVLERSREARERELGLLGHKKTEPEIDATNASRSPREGPRTSWTLKEAENDEKKDSKEIN